MHRLSTLDAADTYAYRSLTALPVPKDTISLHSKADRPLRSSPDPIATMARFVAAAAVALPALAAGALTATQLLHVHDPSTWFGDVALSLAANGGDPIVLLSTWVYGKAEAEAWRPSASTTQPAWRTNVSAATRYETLYVASNGGGGASTAEADALILWNSKPQPMVGPLRLFAVNSAVAPDLTGSGGGDGVVWNATLSGDAQNVNLWVPYTWMALAPGAAAAVGWILGDLGNTTVVGLDAAGRVTWAHSLVVSGANAQYAYSYGVGLSGDGAWAVYDGGIEGVTNQSIYVVDAATGAARGKPGAGGDGAVNSVGLIQGKLSHDGGYTFTADDVSGPHATIHAWDAGAQQYRPVGGVTGPLPPGGAPGSTWFVAGAAFSFDAASGKTLFAALWLPDSLTGATSFAVWDAANLAAGPLANFTQAGDTNNMAVDSAEVACAGLLCAAAMMTPTGGANGTVPTLAVLAGDGSGGVWTAVSPGSQLAVDVRAAASGGGTYYVATAGCDTRSVCTKAGADAYLWRVTL
jgi:hypothetical protein